MRVGDNHKFSCPKLRTGADFFKGEKTWLFWAGLLILSLASVILFAVTWSAWRLDK